jgi:hypothetical protein
MKNILFIIFFQLLVVGIFAQSKDQISSPAGGCGRTIYIFKHPANINTFPGNRIQFIAQACCPTQLNWQSSSDSGLTWNSVRGASVNDYIIPDTLTIENPTIEMNNYLYRCEFTAPCISATTTSALLTVTLPINICNDSSTSIISNIIGSNYQWQMNTGNGFTNIYNNQNFIGTNTNILFLNNVASSYNNYQFRCLVNLNQISNYYTIQLANIWIGSQTLLNEWENPTNWSCGKVPDSNTNVIINQGNISVSSSTQIRSLKLNPNVKLLIKPGIHLGIKK